jgi:hypothetical protein
LAVDYCLTSVVDIDDVRVLEPSVRAGFVVDVGGNELHRDCTVHAGIVRLPHLAHPATAEQGRELVALVDH